MHQQPDDAWNQGDPYERFIGRWSRLVAPEFLSWLNVPPGRDWLDVGCGTGALSSAILQQAQPSSVTGVEPSDGFRETAGRLVGGRAVLLPGTGNCIPLPNATVDVVVSGLVFNFIEDPGGAVREFSRVCRPGGTIGAYVWDYAEGMQFLRAFWDAASVLDPAAAEMDEGVRFPICREGALAETWEREGLTEVSSLGIVVPTQFVDFDDFWVPFLGGQGPAPSYVASLGVEAQRNLAVLLRSRLAAEAKGSLRLTARAWAVKGRC